MPNNYAWEQLSVDDGESPSPRSGHSFTKIGDNFFMFGGMVADTGDRSSVPGPSNDAYFFKIQDKLSCSWEKIECDPSTLPPARTMHSTTAISEDEALIFGGVLSCGPYVCSNDGYLFDASTRSFRKITWSNSVAADALGEGSQRGSALGSRRGSRVEGMSREQAQEHLNKLANPNPPKTKKAMQKNNIAKQTSRRQPVGDDEEEQALKFHESMLALVEPNDGETLPDGSIPSNVPEPRSNHSVVFYAGDEATGRPDRLVLFGGHGGRGYRRKAFNDLYFLTLGTDTWEKAVTGSYVPPERAGHAAFIKGNDMFVFGGWNSDSQYNDLMRLDLETMRWEDVEQPWTSSYPRWNMGSALAEAIPSWKVFIFGGSVGQSDEGAPRTVGNFDATVGVLTLEDRKPKVEKDEKAAASAEEEGAEEEDKFPCFWSDPEVVNAAPAGLKSGTMGLATQRQSVFLGQQTSVQEGEIVKPLGREHAGVLYDPETAQLIVFGGWSHKWLNDVWALDVTSVVGPPYAITSISPTQGPFTGGNEITITGVKLQTSMPKVRFFLPNKQGYVDAASTTFISDTEMKAVVPSLMHLNPPKEGIAKVCLSFNNRDFTTSTCEYEYFQNVSAEHSIFYGPGTIPGGAVDKETVFYVQSKTNKKTNRRSDGDRIEVRIVVTKIRDAPNTELTVLPNRIEYVKDGRYAVYYTPLAEPCEVQVQVWAYDDPNVEQKIALPGSPANVTFVEKPSVKGPTTDLNSQFVTSWVKTTLENMQAFQKATTEGINAPVANDDVLALIEVRKHMAVAEAKARENQVTLDVIAETLVALHQEGASVDQQQKRLKASTEGQNSLMNIKKKKEKELAPVVTAEQDKTRAQMKAFEAEVVAYLDSVKKGPHLQYDTGVEKSFEYLEGVTAECDARQQRMKDLEHVAQSIDVDQSMQESFRVIENTRAEVAVYTKLWTFIKEVLEIGEEAAATRWGDLEMSVLEEEYKARIKQMREMKMDTKIPAVLGISKEIKFWSSSFLPKVGELKDPAMRDRHWDKIRELVQSQFEITDDTTLQLLIDLKIDSYGEKVNEITDEAKQEAKMEKNMQMLEEFWSTQKYDFVPHKTGLTIPKMDEEIKEKLEEHQMVVQGMMANRAVEFFREKVEAWQSTLNSIYDVTDKLVEVAKLWVFLEDLFKYSDEVRKELPEATEKFDDEDKRVREVLHQVSSSATVRDYCLGQGLLQQLDVIFQGMTVCEQHLQRFMEAKRRDFPRFYFVSQQDLLSILSTGNNPHKVMEHMPKIFKAIKYFILDKTEPRPNATGIESSEGIETVELPQPYAVVGKVENYLNSLIDVMRAALKHYAKKSIADRYSAPSHRQWVEADPVAQITLLTNMASWCHDVDASLKKASEGDKNATTEAYEKQVGLLTNLIKMVQGELTDGMRQRVMCLITMDTHGRDIMQKLIDENVTSMNAFQWQSQLKFYWDDAKDDMRININDAVFYYGYEYLGNGARLVVTPLTDRIYVTATQALHLCLGCAPAGPAGTGKTETTKDLASALAKACYVFNCSDQMDYQSMGNIFKGLAASGSWGCFDEFNRLVPEVLSVCSVQFKAVVDAIKSQSPRFTIQDDSLDLDPSCGAFITMNPGYLGRSELPEGLKALFRPITVMVPDLELICENMLMAQGFVDAKQLARKFTKLYALNRDLLSKARHYDWGLRAIKSVLVVAGAFKRREPDMPESGLLMRALRDTNLAKIVGDDLEIFKGLLSDLFPGQNPPANRDPLFRDKVLEVCDKSGLIPEDEFVLKVIQLDELLAIRHCVFVMGSAASGKSSVWKVLSKVKERCTVVDINPKSISSNELYGYMTLQTREWKDGVLSKYMRELSNIDNTDPKWLVLDGDLDANWIESMNSVMDDNKILTLASNERIFLLGHMRMIFEIRDLNYATPATVSRAGIVYMDDSTGYQWQAYYRSWLNRTFPVQNNANGEDQNKGIRDSIEKLFVKYMEATLKFVQRQCKTVVPIVDMSMVMTVCHMLQAILANKETHAAVEYYFVLCVIWACGGPLSDDRKAFDRWWRTEWKIVKFPPQNTVFDYFMDGAVIRDWSQIVKDVPFDSDRSNLRDITVPTTETIAMNYFISRLELEVNWPVMLVGQAGSGKTQLCKGLLGSLKPSEFIFSTINCNYFTDSSLMQNMLEQPLEKKGKNLFPQGQARLIYFIDDINMPMLDPYNTQTAIELLRQNADYSHWYDRSKMELVNVNKTQYLAAMNPTAGSFIINPRLQRHFYTLAVPFPEQEALNRIFNTFLSNHFTVARGFKQSVVDQVPSYIKATLNLHKSVSETFRKTAANFHYEFNIRHLTNVFGGLLQASADRYDSDQIIRLFIHETERTYGDRLVSVEDFRKYQAIAAEVCKKFFVKTSVNFQKMFADKPEFNVFTPYARNLQDSTYDRVESIEKLTALLTESLNEYNDTNAVMDLVLFEDAMKHVCRVSRIITSNAGHAMLVGVGGSGKQSLSKLAASTCQYGIDTLHIKAGYSIADLKGELQGMYNKAGVKEDGMLFLLNESQFPREVFLVYINDLLCSGEIADLYAPDEKDAILNNLRTAAKAADFGDKVWDFFISRIRQNLHVALCFSPVGEVLRSRVRKFPALVNCTVIDWFQPWPKDALRSVAAKFLADVPLEDESREAIVDFMPFSFDAVNNAAKTYLEVDRRYAYSTPKSFLELIKLYSSMLNKRITEIEDRKNMLSEGLDKLNSTAEQVAELNIELQDVRIRAAEAMKEAAEKAEHVGKEKAKVEFESDKANEEAKAAAEIKAEVEKKKAEAQIKLDAAGPAVERANAALDGLEKKKKDFVTVKALNNPPTGVGDVMQCVAYLFANLPGKEFQGLVDIDKKGMPTANALTWAGGRKLIASPDAFLALLQKFKDKISAGEVPPQNFNAIQDIIKKDYFNVKDMATKSTAAAGVCDYIININEFYQVYVTVEPLRVEVAELEQKMEEAIRKNEEAQALVAKLNEELGGLIREFEEADAKKRAEEERLADCERKLNLATRLINALASEKDRWAELIKEFTEVLRLLPGDVLLSSAFVSYLGVFTKKYRDDLMDRKFVTFLKEHAVPITVPTDPLAVLTTPAQVAVWQQEGLPADPVSTENGAILFNSERWPLMIDPQLQGITWIRKRETELNRLRVVRMTTPKKESVFEQTMSLDNCLLIENMGESIDASVAPAIYRQFVVRGVNKICKLGDSEVTVHPQFKLVLHTKLSNPHYPPEIQAECTLINFTVTQKGLEDQLLNIVVGKERPDLAKKRTDIIKQQNNFKIQLDRLEKELLSSLANSEGDILANVALIEGLEETKRVSVDITARVEEAKNTEVLLNEASENYRPVAHRGSLLFFLLTDLSKLHSFYMYSLDAFITVVYRAMAWREGQEEQVMPDPAALAAAAAAAAAKPVTPPVKAPSKKASSKKPSQAASAAGSQVDDGEAPASQVGDDESKVPETDAEGTIVEGEEPKTEETPAEASAEAAAEPAAEAAAAEEAAEEEEEDEDADEEDEEMVEQLTGKALLDRVNMLIKVISMFVFNYCRRGLFERHKIIVAAMLCFRIMLDEGKLSEEEVDLLISGRGTPDGHVPDNCKSWGVTDNMWRMIRAIEVLPKFKVGNVTLSQSLTDDSSSWKRWYGVDKADIDNLPRAYKSNIDPFYHMLLLRALRPDRLTHALREYVEKHMGEEYITQDTFDMYKTYLETDSKTPIFFVLFPGVDPTVPVETCARALGCTTENGKFVNISMGQGQEQIASARLKQAAKEGGWIMLQNVHLMQRWMKETFENELEVVQEDAHDDFRCIITSEPPPFPETKIIPESILQKCVKVADEAPQDLKANLNRAMSKFSPAFFESSEKKAEFKTLIFALCFFHAVILGRKKFGAWGWSRQYSFNDGDLTICGDVLKNYLDANDVIPYDDLRYIFGEIMYGGHITDAWDRRTNNVYLEEIFVPGVLQGLSLIPNRAANFRAPAIERNSAYGVYVKQIQSLPTETPVLFGLHPNAEIGYLTQQSEFVFTSIQEIAGGASQGGARSKEGETKAILDNILARLPDNFNLLEIKEKFRASGEITDPYVIVSLQEAERMNILISEIRRSLEELRLGLAGALNISDAMEKLTNNLYLGRVPDIWEGLAYASKKPLSAWFDDLLLRYAQTDKWTDNPKSIQSLWIAGFFNPMSYLTAIMQVTARAQNLALDHMTLSWRVTPYKDPSDLPPRNTPAFQNSGFLEGEFIHGIFLEGASWEDKSGQEGNLTDSKPKELHPLMPVINVYSLPENKMDWKGMYHCPLYVTSARGATYVTTANLRMGLDDTEAKWVMAGVAALLSDD